jgi:hypothetical protein
MTAPPLSRTTSRRGVDLWIDGLVFLGDLWDDSLAKNGKNDKNHHDLVGILGEFN